MSEPRQRLLDPVERFSEVLFGLIMVLTFTGSISAASAGHAEVRTMLYGAIGCNLAWGLVDGIMYILSALAERGRGHATLRAVRQAGDPAEARRIIGDALPPVVTSILEPASLEQMRRGLQAMPEPRAGARLRKDDLLGALGVFTLVFLSTLPVVLPFVFMADSMRALRVSNGIAVVMLYMTGASLGRYAGYRAWVVGASMVLIGVALVGLTIALGG